MHLCSRFRDNLLAIKDVGNSPTTHPWEPFQGRLRHPEASILRAKLEVEQGVLDRDFRPILAATTIEFPASSPKKLDKSAHFLLFSKQRRRVMEFTPLNRPSSG
jgi:hypothetical protein